jgi:hypothetical protein
MLLSMSWVTMGQSGRSRFRFPKEAFEFLINIILPAALSLRGRLSLYQKWVPGIFTKDKVGRCVGLTTLPPSCTDCHEIWELQPSGTFRVFSRTVQWLLYPYLCGLPQPGFHAEGHFFEPTDELSNYLNCTMTGGWIGKEHQLSGLLDHRTWPD